MEKRKFHEKIEFTNNGQLTLFFTGTGGAFSKNYFQNNLFVVKGKTHILVDCGNLFPYVLETKYNTKLENIQNLFVTHPHADHIGGIEELAFKNYYSRQGKINLIITDKFKKLLWNNSLKGGLNFTDGKKVTLDDYFNQLKPGRIQKKPFEMHEIQVGEINLKIFRTLHVTTKSGSYKKAQYSQGIIIDDRILYTADSQFNENQLKWILQNYEIEAVFHDCDVKGTSRDVHAPYECLKTLDSEIKNKMFLCHCSIKVENAQLESDGFAGLVEAGIYYDF